MVEHGASNAKIMGSIPRESKSWWNVKLWLKMQCKSLWIKVSATCINVNVNVSMVTHTRNWSSAFNPSKCTHTASSEHTHCEHAPGAVGSHCSSARGAIGGSVPCSRAPQSWYWRWRECCSFTIPTFNPCRTWDSNPQPLDYKSDSLTIRPRQSSPWLCSLVNQTERPFWRLRKPLQVFWVD